jgi:hypothetical protein
MSSEPDPLVGKEKLMSILMSLVFTFGLFAVLGLITWAVVAFEMSRGALSMPSGTEASRYRSRELIGGYVD